MRARKWLKSIVATVIFMACMLGIYGYMVAPSPESAEGQFMLNESKNYMVLPEIRVVEGASCASFSIYNPVTRENVKAEDGWFTPVTWHGCQIGYHLKEILPKGTWKALSGGDVYFRSPRPLQESEPKLFINVYPAKEKVVDNFSAVFALAGLFYLLILLVIIGEKPPQIRRVITLARNSA